MFTKLKFGVLVLFFNAFLSVFSQSCDETSSSSYICDDVNGFQEKCKTFAVFRANSRYSSPSNLSSYFGISPSELAEANGFSSDDIEFFSNDQPVLIPIECNCNSGKLFEAEVNTTSIKGESFYEIAEGLEGLTSCKAIRDKNPSISPWNLEESIDLLVPLKCGCPRSNDLRKLLLSYPVREGDTLDGLALEFNVSVESIVLANDRYLKDGFKQENELLPLSTLLIPVEVKPSFSFLAKTQDSNLSIQIDSPKSRTDRRIRRIGIYVAIAISGLLATVAGGVAAFFLISRNSSGHGSIKNKDVEQQQLSLSVRTASDKKVSFEGSHYNFDDPMADSSTTPRKVLVENYSLEDLQKATEDFNVSNLIEGTVFQGRLKGKNLAIKRTTSEVISRVDVLLFHQRIHRHPNIVRFLGTCVVEGSDSFIVHEYAKNGSLKDWIHHRGLAIKSQFIASCNCFLSWNQRLKICLDVATALQYMHHVVNPSYVHKHIKSRNIFLDEEFNAKLGNFGMADCIENEHQWNKEYLAPEVINEGLISPSIDIFAFGVVLLEILSGKPPIRPDEERGEDSFIKLTDEIKSILRSEDAGELKEWMDSALGENYSFDGAVTLANLARSCVEDDPNSRPNDGEIIEKLLRLVQEMPEDDQFKCSCKPLVAKKGEDF